MVTQRPEVAAKLLRNLLGVAIPAFVTARSASTDFTQLEPTEFQADAVVTMFDANGQPALAVVVEVQRSRDQDKPYSWPVYLATLRSRFRCHALLVVLAPDAAIARWCARPIPMGQPGWVLTPLVVGPDNVPVVVDPEEVRAHPWLAAFSVLAHHEGSECKAMLEALVKGLESIDPAERVLYRDLVMAGLPEEARRQMERVMGIEEYEFKNAFAREVFIQGEERGQAKGEAKALIAVLVARGIPVTEALQEQILKCRDTNQLTEWLTRAANASRVDDLFA